ncbi:hypothetical protein [Solimonas marina]|uniref:YtkA-like domain-containing protein n=1 Tax=Solimonas marina TaxID=2714601 RepID=A0A969W9S3_9GAMM|nr:hypothetical protein [Solimonas marina]NKF23381.1 hypothetical protein [Solimonas marina]
MLIGNRKSSLLTAVFVAGLLPAISASADMKSDMAKGGMAMTGMHMDTASDVKPTTQAYTSDHRYFITLDGMPKSIPEQDYFTLHFSVFDGQHPKQPVSGFSLDVQAGMRHGMKNGFAHGMQSSPKISVSGNTATVSGLMFHMMGTWTLQLTVHDGQHTSVADFELPCCSQ